MTNPDEGLSPAQKKERDAEEREALLEFLKSLPKEDIEVGHGPWGEPYLYRRDEFLCGPAERVVLDEELNQVADQITNRRRPLPPDKDRLGTKDRDYFEPFGVTNWRVKRGLSALDVVSDLRGRITDGQLQEMSKDRQSVEVSLNHVHTGAGIFKFGPGTMPAKTNKSVSLTQFTAAPSGQRPPLVAILDTGTLAESHMPGQNGARMRSHEIRADPDDQDPVLEVPQRPIAGHGIFVSGILCRHAHLQIDPESTMSGNGITDENELLLDIRDVIDRAQASGAHGPDVVNLSLYGYPADLQPTFPAAFAQAISRSPKTAWVAAAGNDDDSRRTWPASLPDVVGVGSVDASGQKSDFSNFGDWVRACAVGEAVLSVYLNKKVRVGNDEVEFTGAAEWSGTSFAVPIVCAAIIAKMRATGLDAAHAVGPTLDAGEPKFDQGLGRFIRV